MKNLANVQIKTEKSAKNCAFFVVFVIYVNYASYAKLFHQPSRGVIHPVADEDIDLAVAQHFLTADC